MKIKRLFPISVTPNIKECKEFYTRFFSFEVVFEADWYIHLRNESEVEIAFMMPNLQNQPDFLHEVFSGKGVVLSFEVDDAKAEYERIKKLQASFIQDLKDEEWGQRHFMLVDPAGMVPDIVQQL
ncbi:MAG: VOC family protein [Methanolobus sp.]|uniref:VOC family protein n=1 Tax=Methanolobus sp. TaxID=1874737 RepID=UPI00272F1BEB|nr:VOC family protein [Methanolobus sp.]MDP2218152.1 VOC family protein [Methanolobus sp.]